MDLNSSIEIFLIDDIACANAKMKLYSHMKVMEWIGVLFICGVLADDNMMIFSSLNVDEGVLTNNMEPTIKPARRVITLRGRNASRRAYIPLRRTFQSKECGEFFLCLCHICWFVNR